MEILHKLLYNFAAGLCHQLPERTFHFANFSLPFCARCTGVYWGFLSGFIGIYLTSRKRSGLPVSTVRWMSVFLLAIFPLEVFTERFFPFSVLLFLRTYIAAGFGVSCSLYLVPLFNRFFWYKKGEDKPVLNNPMIFLTILLASIGIFELMRLSALLAAGWIIGLLSVAGAILLYLMLNLTLVSSIPWFRRFSKGYLVQIPLSSFLTALEITLIKAVNGRL